MSKRYNIDKEYIEWCHSVGIEETRVIGCDMVSMEVLYECWCDRQEKLKEKDEELKELALQIKRKDSTIVYLEQFIKFCPKCHNPKDDCICH